MSEVRKEKRNPERLQLLISRMADPLFIEPASTACACLPNGPGSGTFTPIF
jgi:hypothetical protein